MKLWTLKKYIAVNLYDCKLYKFLDIIAKAQKYDKADFIKMENFVLKKVRQSTELNKIFARYKSDNGLVSRIHEEHNSTRKKTKHTH